MAELGVHGALYGMEKNLGVGGSAREMAWREPCGPAWLAGAREHSPAPVRVGKLCFLLFLTKPDSTDLY